MHQTCGRHSLEIDSMQERETFTWVYIYIYLLQRCQCLWILVRRFVRVTVAEAVEGSKAAFQHLHRAQFYAHQAKIGRGS